MGAFLSVFTDTNTTSAPATNDPGTSGPWRPPQWISGPTFGEPPLTLTATDPLSQQITVFVFDNILRAEHEQQSVITLNPVQTGAAITDNAYVVPPRLTVEIAMSDAMQSYTTGQWANAPSRSVSAYQTLVALQSALTPVSIATKLRQYDNMMVTDVRANEDKDTKFALRATVTFTQILTASVQITDTTNSTSGANSEIPQSTGQTATGQVQTTPVPQSIQSQNDIQNSNPPFDTSVVPVVDGSGNYSSYNTSGLGNVLN